MISHVVREWRFMLTQRYVIMLMLCAALVSAFAVATGVSEVNSQRQTIERLKLADQIDRTEAQAKYNDPGSLAYYSFHLTYNEPSNLAFAALGERDVYSWKHRIRMLALEGQIYESDTQNAELAQAGKIDFAFVISVLSPLFLILLFHDLIANERTSGRHDLLVTTANSPFALWGSRVLVRFLAITLCLLAPFFIGSIISQSGFIDVLLVTFLCTMYFTFWTLLSVYMGKTVASSPRIASSLIGLWVMFAFVIPIVADLMINESVHSPKGGDILLVQRESVNDAWDLPVDVTMDAFVAKHPEYKDYKQLEAGFDWAWYYAFQQVGDQTAAPISEDYRKASERKYELAGYASLFSPPLLFQRKITRLANTDPISAIEYEKRIREFHKSLRHFYYPWLFKKHEFNKSRLQDLPRFEEIKNEYPK